MKGGHEEDILSFFPSLPNYQEEFTDDFELKMSSSDLDHIFPTIGVNGATTVDITQLRPVARQKRDQAGRFTGGWTTKPGQRVPGNGAVPRDESEKNRLRQIKLQQRKQRNKEAARLSNLKKQIHRQNLEQKQTALMEQKLQLENEIQKLFNRLHHVRQVYTAMHHVCSPVYHYQQTYSAAC